MLPFPILDADAMQKQLDKKTTQDRREESVNVQGAGEVIRKAPSQRV